MIGVNPAILALSGDGAGIGSGAAVTLVSPATLPPSVALARASAGLALGADGTTWSEIPADRPRFHGSARRLLVEERRTNILANARTPGGTGWTTNGLVVTAGVPGPDGAAASATRLTETAVTGQHRAQTAVSFISGQSYTFAAIFRATGTCGTVQAVAPSSAFGSTVYANFDLANGTVGLAGSGVTRAICERRGQWTVCAMSGIATGSSSDLVTWCLTEHANAARGAGYAGTSRHTDAWAAWIEQAPFASSPILPSAGAPAAATREADAPAWTLPAGYPAQGTALIKAMIPRAAPAGLDQGLFQLDDGADSNRIVLRNAAGGNTVTAAVVSGGATQATLSGGATTPGTAFRAALAWGPAGCALCLSGGAVVSTATAPPAGLTRLLIGHAAAALNRALNGEVEALSVQPARLSDAEVQALANAP